MVGGRSIAVIRALGKCVRALSGDRRAGTAIEYGLIVALIVIAMISALSGLADVTTGMWNNVSDKVMRAH
ncbi:Flp family type IVb pilin [Sphingomonas koreensis]|nr:Flp family type IVb pilin [Sphingomonas koreensis]